MTNFAKIKQYFTFLRPKMSIFFVMLIFKIISAVCLTIFAYGQTRVVFCIAIFDTNGAKKWIIWLIILLIIAKILDFFTNRLHYINVKALYKNVYGNVYDKLEQKDDNMSERYCEKIINTLSSNMLPLENLPYDLIEYFCNFVKAALIIAIMARINLLLCLAVVLSCAVFLIILNFLHKKIYDYQNSYYFYQDKSLEILADTYNLAANANQKTDEQKQNEYLKDVRQSLNFRQKYGILDSACINLVGAVCQAIVFALSVYLVIMYAENFITFGTYLILTQFLSKLLGGISSSSGLLFSINSANVAVLRLKTILNMPSHELLQFGHNITNQIDGSVIFSGVSSAKSAIFGELKNINVAFEPKKISAVVGEHLSGKRAMFYLLTRKIKPTSGTITVSNINIFEFDPKVYNQNVTYAVAKPFFYSGSIMSNMKYYTTSKKKIYEACKQAKIHDKILSLKDSYQTEIDASTFNDFELFLLGLARCICSSAEIILIYDLPNISPAENQTLKAILNKLVKSKTIIIFSHDRKIFEFSHKKYTICDGKLSKIN